MCPLTLQIAYRHGVFKVETVGDCYVAVGGLPEPREDHALIAAKFSRDCLYRMKELVRGLEVSLGPDTGDLELRIGMNSGQVTAGVLRGERSRFQLFGDTMNTTARMEHLGKVGHIHMTKATADEIRNQGLSSWVIPRADKIHVKGKGEMETYWLETKEQSALKRKILKHKHASGSAVNRTVQEMAPEMAPLSENGDSVGPGDEEDDDMLDDEFNHLKNLTKEERLVEWNVEILSFLIQQILACRDDVNFSNNDPSSKIKDKREQGRIQKLESRIGENSTVLEEFRPIITLPNIGVDDLRKRKNPHTIKLPPLVVSELRDFISEVASMYRPNPFHNFEHASHVTASVRKLLTRIVSADSANRNGLSGSHGMELVDLAGHSYGITSDPLTQFAVVFSAIIHDADHPGVPNTQVSKPIWRVNMRV